jgi:hypothetical protein
VLVVSFPIYTPMADRTIDQLVNNLSLVNISSNSESHDSVKSTDAFRIELEATKLTIFIPISDCGFYGWNPSGQAYESLSSIQTSNEIRNHIELDKKPTVLFPISQLQLPQLFDISLEPKAFLNQYPYGQYDIASLHVAAQHRNVNLNEMNFVFGGSTLEMLARHDKSNPYMATRIPNTTNTILVVKCKEYAQNFSDVGFQFERFVTGMKIEVASENVEFVEHMHVMQIGSTYKVLFCAETDASDHDGNPVEIKISDPKYWRTKVMFQMISSGSTKLCAGIKRENILTSIKIISLSDVVNIALRYRNPSLLEENILSGMKALQEQMIDAKDGEVYKISFSNDNGELKLQLTNTADVVLLPPTNIVEELILR